MPSASVMGLPPRLMRARKAHFLNQPRRTMRFDKVEVETSLDRSHARHMFENSSALGSKLPSDVVVTSRP
jgi:hypothetical protein